MRRPLDIALLALGIIGLALLLGAALTRGGPP